MKPSCASICRKRSAARRPKTRPKQLDIAISAEGVFSVNNQVLPKNDLATLMEALQKESNGDTNRPLSISADGKTQHQSVITAMDAAGKLGFSHLRMTTVEAAPPAP